MKLFFSTLTMLLFTSIAFAQKPGDPFPGFAVANSGDTLKGGVTALKKNGNIRPSFQIKFDDESTKTLGAKKYKFVKAGDMEFESYEIPGNAEGDWAFFYKKSSGKVTLYEYQYEVYEMNKTVWKSEFYLKNKAGELDRINKANYKKKLQEVFAEKSEFIKKIEDVKFEDIYKLIDEFNEA